MKDKVRFTRKISRSGQAKVLLITIPQSLQPLVEFGKEYLVTLEELPVTNNKRSTAKGEK